MKDDIALAVFRHVSTMLGFYLASNGYNSGATEEQISGALFILLGVGWSAYKARKNKQQVATLKQEVAVKDVIIEQQANGGVLKDGQK